MLGFFGDQIFAKKCWHQQKHHFQECLFQFLFSLLYEDEPLGKISELFHNSKYRPFYALTYPTTERGGGT